MPRGGDSDAEYDDDEVENGDDGDDIADIDDSFLNDLQSPQKTPFKKATKYNVFIMKGEPSEEMKFVSLPMPISAAKAPKKAKYIITPQKEILEIQRGKGTTSWFMNNRVSEDGSLFLATPIDPLFFMLERLEHLRGKHAASDGKFVTADQIFTDPSLPDFQHVKFPNLLADLSLICDVKEISKEPFYRLNDDRVIQWLKRKVDSIVDYLETMPDAMSLIRAQVVGFKLTADEKPTNDQLINLAVGFLKEYVPSNWINALKNDYGLDAAALEAIYFDDTANKKKRKADDLDDDLDDVKTPAKKLKKSVSQNKLDKVDKSGMKSMMSFFKPVAKK